MPFTRSLCPLRVCSYDTEAAQAKISQGKTQGLAKPRIASLKESTQSHHAHDRNHNGSLYLSLSLLTQVHRRHRNQARKRTAKRTAVREKHRLAKPRLASRGEHTKPPRTLGVFALLPMCPLHECIYDTAGTQEARVCYAVFLNALKNALQCSAEERQKELTCITVPWMIGCVGGVHEGSKIVEVVRKHSLRKATGSVVRNIPHNLATVNNCMSAATVLECRLQQSHLSSLCRQSWCKTCRRRAASPCPRTSHGPHTLHLTQAHPPKLAQRAHANDARRRSAPKGFGTAGIWGLTIGACAHTVAVVVVAVVVTDGVVVVYAGGDVTVLRSSLMWRFSDRGTTPQAS
jgi:hypothetical protein